jgi:hypothetical protein
MSKTVEAKVKIIKDKDLAEMFNQMLGAGSVNMNIVYPKYLDMKDRVAKLLDTLNCLNKSPLMKTQSLELLRRKIEAFIETSRENIGKVFSMSFDNYEWNLNLVENKDRDEFAKVYEAAKKSELVNVFMFICNDLHPYRKFFDKDKLDAKFVNEVPGSEFCPLPFAKEFDVKQILEQLFLEEKKHEQMIRFIMIVLSKLYELSYGLYKILGSPDIDVDEFVEVIMNNISEIKKRIPRCDKAFDKIIHSVKMLKENFPSYYKDFIETKNSTIIMENFVLDVSRTTKADAETTRQFKSIIDYYRKISANQIKNPKVKKLFDAVSENFKHLEQHDNLGMRGEQDILLTDNSIEIADDTPEQDKKKSRKEERQDKQQEEYEKKSVDDLLKDIKKK